MEKKKVLLILETRNDIISYFKGNLENLGFEVATYPNAPCEPYQLSTYDKVKNILLTALGIANKSLEKKKEDHHQSFAEQIVDDPLKKNYDVTIIFRPDLLENSFLENIKSISAKMIAYQWDGIDRYPAILEKIAIFDDFFCFNPEDVAENIKFLPNFYFDHLNILPEKSKYGITYIGYYYDDRFELLEKIGSSLKNVKLNFLLRPFTDEQFLKIKKSKNIQHIKQIYSYKKLLSISNKSDVLLDIKHPAHSGLSFRFFEGMLLQKKIITTNDSVVNYDFYNPKNVMILKDNHVEEEFRAFLAQPYQPLEMNILKKYSFSNWFDNLINAEKKISFEIPLNKTAK